MNKYYRLTSTILRQGRWQKAGKGRSQFIHNMVLSMAHFDVDQIIEEHKIPKKLLTSELALYMKGERSVAEYELVGINWWAYARPLLVNTYPSYFSKLPRLLNKINAEKSSSKNYMLHLGETGVPTSQQPCISTIHFQITGKLLTLSVHVRSCDVSLGLPCDIYQMWLISQMIDVPLVNITMFISNCHIYENNIEATQAMLAGQPYKFTLNT